MKKILKRTQYITMAALVSLGATGGVTLPASAATGFVCPEGSNLPYASYYADGDTTAIGSTTIDFTGKGIACGAPIATYTWDFGDGTTATGADATHTYGLGTFKPTLTVTDEAGLAATSTGTIIVKDSNTAPVATPAELYTDATDLYELNLSSYITDPDGDQLSLVSASTSTPVPNMHVAVSSSLQGVIYVSTYGKSLLHGVDVTVNYQVTDSFGGVTDGTSVIHFVDAAPVAQDATLQATEDQQATLDMNSYVSDAENDPLTFTLGTPQHGSVYYAYDHTIAYVPAENYNGPDSFTYTVNDGFKSTTGTITVNVAPANDAPTMQSRTVTTNEDTSVTFNPLASATDIDGDALTLVDATVPYNGTVVKNADGTVTVTPQANYTGTLQVNITYTDGTVTVHGQVEVKVTAVNDAPVITDFVYSNNSKGGKTASFKVTATDVDDGASNLTYTYDFGDGTVSGPSPYSSSTSHTYSRKGTYTVKVTVTDPSGATATRTMTITI